RPAALLVHQAKLQHAGHVEGRQEAFETDFHLSRRNAAQLRLPFHVSRRFAVRIRLLLLLGGSRRRRFGGPLRSGGFGRSSFCRRGLLFFSNVRAQLAFGGEQSAIGNSESFVLLLSHKFGVLRNSLPRS